MVPTIAASANTNWNEILIEQLNTLHAIISRVGDYKTVYNYITEVKGQHGTIYGSITDTGVSNTIIRFEDITLRNSAKEDIVLMDTLNKLTADFSLLSGLNTKLWIGFVAYVNDSHRRIFEKLSSDGTYSETGLPTRGRLLLAYPWLVVILLLEVLYIANP